MNSKAFDRIFVIIFENELESAVRQNAYMRDLESRGVRMSEYYGVTHPSQPNYIASIAGLPYVTCDKCQDIDATNLVDLLEGGGVSWKAYMEDLPDDKTACKVGLYYRKHNPFVSFNNVRNNPARLARIVNATELQADVDGNTLPQYCWYTPNIQNDGHSPPNTAFGSSIKSVDFLAAWLQSFLEPLLKNPNFTKGTLVVVTFDESIPYADNHIYTTLLGEMVTPGSVQADRYDHYSLLRTDEENFNLPTLGRNDLTAHWFRFLWKLPQPAFDPRRHQQ